MHTEIYRSIDLMVNCIPIAVQLRPFCHLSLGRPLALGHHTYFIKIKTKQRKATMETQTYKWVTSKRYSAYLHLGVQIYYLLFTPTYNYHSLLSLFYVKYKYSSYLLTCYLYV